MLGNAAQILTKFFGLCARDRTSHESAASKKWLLLDIMNNLCSIYFAINKLHLCKNLIKTIEEGRDLPPLEKYPMAVKVTYQYYVGKIDMFDSEFTTAKKRLLYAFNNCSKTSNNRKVILQYLIPVQWICGKSASASLLKRHGLKEFVELNTAYKTGNLRAFQMVQDKYLEFLIRKGIFIVVEKAKTLVYRNLLRIM